MKKILCLLCTVFSFLLLHAQDNYADNLKFIINQQKGDTTEVNTLAYYGDYLQRDSGMKYAGRGLLLAKQIGYKKGEADCNLLLGTQLNTLRDYAQGIQFLLRVAQNTNQLLL